MNIVSLHHAPFEGLGSMKSAVSLIENCREDFIDESPYIQKPEFILSQIDRFDVLNRYMRRIWEQIEKMNYT